MPAALRFCGACGAAVERDAAGRETTEPGVVGVRRGRVCEACRRRHRAGEHVAFQATVAIYADGTTTCELAGARPFPRHWLDDDSGRLVRKSGLIDFANWYGHAQVARTPWDGTDRAPWVVDAESAFERSLSVEVIDIGPQWRRLDAGELLVAQGDPGDDVYLLFDGVMQVEVDDEPIAAGRTSRAVGLAATTRSIAAGGRPDATAVGKRPMSRPVWELSVTTPTKTRGSAAGEGD